MVLKVGSMKVGQGLCDFLKSFNLKKKKIVTEVEIRTYHLSKLYLLPSAFWLVTLFGFKFKPYSNINR